MSGFSLPGELNANMQHFTLEGSDTSALQEYVTSILPDSFRVNFGEDFDHCQPLDFGHEPPILWPDEAHDDFSPGSRAEANYNPNIDLWSTANGDPVLGSHAEANCNPNAADPRFTANGDLTLGSQAEENHNPNLWSITNGDRTLGSQAEADYNVNGDLWSAANSDINSRCDADGGGLGSRAEPYCSEKPKRNPCSMREDQSTVTNCDENNQRVFGLWNEEQRLDEGLQLNDGPLLLDSEGYSDNTYAASPHRAAEGRKGYRHRHTRKYLQDKQLQMERNRELNNEASVLYRKRKKETASEKEDQLQHLQQEHDNLCNKLQLLTVQSDWCHDVYVKYNDYFALPLDDNLLP